MCIRRINCTTLNVYEDFLGFYIKPNVRSVRIITTIKDAFIRFQLSFSSLRGQTYNGAGNMMGVRSGVVTQTNAIQTNALETHCHTHSVSLAVKETAKKSKVLRDTLDTVCKICVSIKFSPKREKQYEKVQKIAEAAFFDDAAEVVKLDKLCLTRWTVQARCLAKVTELYEIYFYFIFTLFTVDLKLLIYTHK